MSKQIIVIVGGVAAGASAAAKARRCSEEAEIIIYEKGPFISYANCGLPYYLSGVIEKRQNLLIVDPPFFKKRFNIEVKTKHEVVAIDAERKIVTVKELSSGHLFGQPYDKLILAPGADPVILPIPGNDLPFVFCLKTLEDTDSIYDFLKREQPRRAVVIGGGLIGMEAVENLVMRGVKTTVVEFLPQVLSFLDPEMAEQVHRHLRSKGVNLCLAEKVTAIRGENGRKVVETDKGSYDADLVIMAVGVRPSTRLAKNAGLEIGASGGIKTDKYMQTTVTDIYAAGDCVESIHHVTGKPAVFPMGSAANKQGRAAGANALGRKIEVKGFCGTAIVKVFDLTVAITGLSERQTMQEKITPYATYVLGGHHAGYYPGAKVMEMKTIADAECGRLLGAQIIGQEGVDKRIDVMATAIYNKMSAEELIDLDLAYAPPYASARDLVIVAGALAQNYNHRDWLPITPMALKVRVDDDRDNFILLDARSAPELKNTGVIKGATHIPLDDLRQRIDELDKDKEIIAYCAVGLRSYLVSRILSLNGYPNVKTLTGGISAWPFDLESI